MPAELARRIANLPALPLRPISCWSPTAPARDVADVAATYFAAEAFFHLDRIARAARGIVISDYFDRLALDRALDSIGDAERRLTGAMAGNGVAGAEAVEAWVAPRRHEVERIRVSVHEIANSGLDALEAGGGGKPAGGFGQAVGRDCDARSPHGAKRNAGACFSARTIPRISLRSIRATSIRAVAAAASMPEMPDAGEHHGDAVRRRRP